MLEYFDAPNAYGYAINRPPVILDPSGLFGISSWCQAKLLEFNCWYQQQKELGSDWLQELPACPCSVAFTVTIRPGWFWNTEEYTFDVDESVWYTPLLSSQFFHPGSLFCMRSQSTMSGHAQQCCYDAAGRLITHGLGAGTPDLNEAAAENLILAHLIADVVEYNVALALDSQCTLFPQYADLYLEMRPPNNGNGCATNP